VVLKTPHLIKMHWLLSTRSGIGNLKKRGEFAFLLSRIAKSTLLYATSLLVQIFLVKQFDPSVNASYQLSLKWISLFQLLFISGYGLLVLNASQHPERYQALWEGYKVYQIFNLIIAPIALMALLAIGKAGVLGHSAGLALPIVVMLSALVGATGEISSFRYALGDYVRYEYGSLIAAVLSTLSISLIVLVAKPWHIDNFVLAASLLIATLAPSALYNSYYLAFSLRGSRQESLVPIGHRLASSGALKYSIFHVFHHLRSLTGKKSLILKAKTFQALQAVAVISWGTDLLIVGALGGSSDVNQSSFTISLFSFATIVVALYSQRLQIFYSDSASRGILFSYIGPKVSHCVLAAIPALFIYLATLLARIVFPSISGTIGGHLLVSTVALATLISQVASLQGIYLNAASKPGRQVLNNLLFLIPGNLGLSIAMYPAMGPPGVFAATIITLLLSSAVNTAMVRSYANLRSRSPLSTP
jgi:hypothetical protein